MPQITPGAPEPLVLASEQRVILSYWVERPTDAEISVASSHASGVNGPDVYSVFRFSPVCSHMFGYPNEEAFHGHPLACRGYRAFAVWEVQKSSWIAQMEQMNRVHPAHTRESFDIWRHFIFGFHDSTFEIVARPFEFELMYDHWNRTHVIPRMRELLK